MPTLIRFAIICAVIFVLGFTAMFALATFVEPSRKQTTVRVPIERLTEPD